MAKRKNELLDKLRIRGSRCAMAGFLLDGQSSVHTPDVVTGCHKVQRGGKRKDAGSEPPPVQRDNDGAYCFEAGAKQRAGYRPGSTRKQPYDRMKLYAGSKADHDQYGAGGIAYKCKSEQHEEVTYCGPKCRGIAQRLRPDLRRNPDHIVLLGRVYGTANCIFFS